MRRHSRRALLRRGRAHHTLEGRRAATHRLAARRLAGQRGQNTVEYLLMLTVVVGVVLAAGMALKRFFPGLIENIKGMISGTAGALGSGGN